MLSTIAAVRFGYGADQGNDLPALTQQLVGDDTVVQDYPNMTPAKHGGLSSNPHLP